MRCSTRSSVGLYPVFPPDSLFTRTIILRSLWIWIGVRLLIAALGIPMMAPVVPTTPGPALSITALTVALAALEMRRNDEFLLLANLGRPPARLLLLAAIVPTLIETAIVAVAWR